MGWAGILCFYRKLTAWVGRLASLQPLQNIGPIGSYALQWALNGKVHYLLDCEIATGRTVYDASVPF